MYMSFIVHSNEACSRARKQRVSSQQRVATDILQASMHVLKLHNYACSYQQVAVLQHIPYRKCLAVSLNHLHRVLQAHIKLLVSTSTVHSSVAYNIDQLRYCETSVHS